MQPILRRYPTLFGVPVASAADDGVDVAIVTAFFNKRDGTSFTEEEKGACSVEFESALDSLLSQAELPQGVTLRLSVVNTLSGSFEVEFVLTAVGLALSALGATPIMLSQLGRILRLSGDKLVEFASGLSLCGEWLEGVAFRLLPANPNLLPESDRRPGCFGVTRTAIGF